MLNKSLKLKQYLSSQFHIHNGIWIEEDVILGHLSLFSSVFWSSSKTVFIWLHRIFALVLEYRICSWQWEIISHFRMVCWNFLKLICVGLFGKQSLNAFLAKYLLYNLLKGFMSLKSLCLHVAGLETLGETSTPSGQIRTVWVHSTMTNVCIHLVSVIIRPNRLWATLSL